MSPVPPSKRQKSRPMDDVIVRVQQGRLRGVPAGYGYRFLGIPYARAPAETGRFAPPEPARDRDGVRDANVFGATALQPDHGVSLARELLVPGAECLNLNVFTPVLGRQDYLSCSGSTEAGLRTAATPLPGTTGRTLLGTA